MFTKADILAHAFKDCGQQKSPAMNGDGIALLERGSTFGVTFSEKAEGFKPCGTRKPVERFCQAKSESIPWTPAVGKSNFAKTAGVTREVFLKCGTPLKADGVCPACGAKHKPLDTSPQKRMTREEYKAHMRAWGRESIIIRREGTETRIEKSRKTGKVTRRIVVDKSTGTVIAQSGMTQEQERTARKTSVREHKYEYFWNCSEGSVAGVSRSARGELRTPYPMTEAQARKHFQYALSRESLHGCSVWRDIIPAHLLKKS